MKIFAIAILSVFGILSFYTSSVKAQEGVAYQNSLTPRQLVSLARHGNFKAQGIPGYSGFGSAVRSGKVNAEKLVASAVVQNKLPSNALQDESYLNAIDEHLKSGGCGSS